MLIAVVKCGNHSCLTSQPREDALLCILPSFVNKSIKILSLHFEDEADKQQTLTLDASSFK